MRIDEIFGPVIQGEGELAGTVTMFVRTGGCDSRCSWCDTLHAVLPENERHWSRMTPDEVCDRLDQVTPAHVRWVTISGGNPAIWLDDLPELVLKLKDRNRKVNIETQGTVPNRAFKLADMVTISPKGPSSGEPFKQEKLAECILLAQSRHVLKFVISGMDDFRFAKRVSSLHPFSQVFVQPQTAVIDGRATFLNFPELCDQVASDEHCAKWRVIPQIHALAFPGVRGK